MNLRICIVGYGNIARRYIKIIENILKSNNINFQITVIRSGQNLHEKTNPKYKSINYIPGKKWIEFDCVFIVSPLPIKLEQIRNFPNTIIFVDKPLFIKREIEKDFLQKIDKKQLKNIFVGYCMRYHPELNAIKKELKRENLKKVNLEYFTNMKKWRPNIMFKKSSSAKSFYEGGGAACEISHEIDLFHILNKLIYKENYLTKIIEVKLDKEFNHDYGFCLESENEKLKIKTLVNCKSIINKRNIIFTFKNKKRIIYELNKNNDIETMYEEMIKDLLITKVIKKMQKNIKLPKLNELENITDTIEKIHKLIKN